MTRSKLKIAIIGLIASAIMLALFLVPGIKSPASAETWEVFGDSSNNGMFKRPDTVTADFDKVTFHGEEPAVNALKVTLGDIVIGDVTYNIVQNSSNACIDMTFEYYVGDTVHTTTLNYEDGGAVDGFYFQCTHPDANTTVLAFDVTSSASDSHFNLMSGVDGLECVFDDVTDITKDWYLTLSAVYSGQGESYKMTFSRIQFNPSTQIASFELSEIEKAYKNGYDAGYNAGLDAGYANGSQAGYNAGKTAGLAEGKKNGYDEGYAAGLAAAKDNTSTEDKTDEKPDNTITSDDTSTSDTTSWLVKNKTTLIVGSLLVVGMLVLLCILNGTSRRRR